MCEFFRFPVFFLFFHFCCLEVYTYFNGFFLTFHAFNSPYVAYRWNRTCCTGETAKMWKFQLAEPLKPCPKIFANQWSMVGTTRHCVKAFNCHQKINQRNWLRENHLNLGYCRLKFLRQHRKVIGFYLHKDSRSNTWIVLVKVEK